VVGKPDGKTPLGRPRRRWEGNIRMDLREIRCEDVECMHLFEVRDNYWALVNTVMKLRIP
jgi:hypothetical protein